MPAVTTTAEIDAEQPYRIAVYCDYRVKDAVKAVPGARWDSKRRQWSVPLAWTSCLALRAEFGASLTIGPALREWASGVGVSKRWLREQRTALDVDPAIAKELDEEPGFDELFSYQLSGAVLAATAGGYIFMDETGTGKSRTALATLAFRAANGEVPLPCLVVAPKSMLRTWAREIEGFFPGADVRLCTGTPTVVKKALEPGGDFYVINYDALRRYSRIAGWGSISLKDEERVDKELQAIEFRALIADEAHRAKSPKAAQTRALWAASAKATLRIALTGTPIQDTPDDMWALLYLVAPMEYPNRTSFVERYLQAEWNMWGGRDIEGIRHDRAEEFFANLETRCRRITKAVALPFLPPKVFEVRWVTLPPKNRKAYDRMRDELVAELESGGEMAADSVLERAGRLVQLANSSMDVEIDAADPTATPRYRMVAPSPKIDAFMDDVKAGDFDGHSVVVYSDSRQLIDLLSEEMDRLKIEHARVTGAEDAADRQAAMDAFQAGHVQYILLTRAGGEGITLTKADVMVRLVRSWSLTNHKQAEDRVHRIGSEQHESVLIIDYLTEGTVEEGQQARLNAKEARAQEVLRDKELLDMIRPKS